MNDDDNMKIVKCQTEALSPFCYVKWEGLQELTEYSGKIVVRKAKQVERKGLLTSRNSRLSVSIL